MVRFVEGIVLVLVTSRLLTKQINDNFWSRKHAMCTQPSTLFPIICEGDVTDKHGRLHLNSIVLVSARLI